MKEDKKKLLQYFIAAALIIIIAYFMIKYGKRLTHLRIRHVRSYILSYGKFASIIFVLIYSLKPILLVVPVLPLSIVAGSVFGPYKALLLSMIGCFTSATLAFFLAKFLGRSFVDKLLKGKAMKLDSNIEKHGALIMGIMRLSFVFPYDPLSYAAGLTKMKYKDFILGTMIGIFPEMVSYSFIGKSLEHPFSIKFFIPIISIIVIALTSLYVYKSSKKTKNL
jgi:uncharacterized membrane protein YdjX (TVP38/TMEM64 family)